MKKADEFHLDTDLKFPITLKGDVIFNEQAIKAICELVGIEALSIKTQDGKTVVTISAIGIDGAATMGGAKYMPESSSNLKDFDFKDLLKYASFRFNTAEIFVDFQQLYNDMISSGVTYSDAREAKIWAERLDAIIKKELLRLVYLKQKSNLSSKLETFQMMFSVILGGLIFKDILAVNDAVTAVKTFNDNIWSVITIYLPKLLANLEFRDYKNRLSVLFPYGVELDRAVMSSFLIFYRKLVASVES